MAKVDLSRVKEYQELGWTKEEALKMVKEEAESEEASKKEEAPAFNPEEFKKEIIEELKSVTTPVDQPELPTATNINSEVVTVEEALERLI